jgi:hypothetical protein
VLSVADFPGLEAALRFSEGETAARDPAVSLSRRGRDGEAPIEVFAAATASGRPRWLADGD